MGCLNVSIQQVSGCQTGFDRVGGLSSSYDGKNGCKATYEPRNGMTAEYGRKGGMKVILSFVCRVGKRQYLRVTPDEPIWITVDESGVFTVRSNTEWVVL